MKQILAVMCVVALAFFITGCEKAEADPTHEEYVRVKSLQWNANEVVGHIQYIKDPRTGLCFANYWGGGGNGGPSLATVPCEAIPTELLTVAK